FLVSLPPSATLFPYTTLFRSECFVVTQFLLETYNCPPVIYNAVSTNNDGMNDNFFIDGLRDIFINFELLIFNRWGKHLWTGNNRSEEHTSELQSRENLVCRLL